FTALVARPGGAQQLASAVAQQPTDIAESLTCSVGWTLTAAIGSNLLSSLLGRSSLLVLTSTVSKLLDVGEQPIRTLLGLLTCLILSVLGREQSTAGLDAGGLAQMLTAQKDEITAALPVGLSPLFATDSRLRECVAYRISAERRSYGACGTTYA